MEVRDFTAKTVDEAITAATLELGISSDQLDYEVIDEGSKVSLESLTASQLESA